MSSELQMGKVHSPRSGNAPGEGMALNTSTDKDFGAIPSVISPYEVDVQSWPLVKLSDLITIKHGFAFKGEFFSDEPTELQLTTPGNFAIGGGFQIGKGKYYAGEYPAEYVLKHGDLIVTMTDLSKAADTLGYAAIVPETEGTTWLHNQRVGLVQIKPDAPVVLEFLHYLLRTTEYRHWVVSTATGSTVKHTSPGRICEYEFRLPPEWIQVEIGKILTAQDDRIALLRETNATLEAMAQALFKSWFVDFDPVHANAGTKQMINPASSPSDFVGDPAAPLDSRLRGNDDLLPPELQTLFPATFTETPQGLVPEGWKLVPFGELLTHTIGGDWGDEQPTEKNDVRVAIIRGTDLPDLANGHSGRVPVRFTNQKKLATRKLQDGDLVLEVSGGSKDQPTGRSLYLTNGILGQFDCPMEPASFCRLLRPATQDIGVMLAQHMTYIYAQGKTWEYQNQSTGISNFQTTHFLETELVMVPSDDVLKAFSETIRPMIDRAHLTQIAQLATLRDTLLPRLISGQLRLPDSEAALVEVG